MADEAPVLPSHMNTIYAMRSLNYLSNKGGICSGLAYLWEQAVLSKEEEKFNQHITLINDPTLLEKFKTYNELVKQISEKTQASKILLRKPVTDIRKTIHPIQKSYEEAIIKYDRQTAEIKRAELNVLENNLKKAIQKRDDAEAKLEKDNFTEKELKFRDEISEVFEFLDSIEIIQQLNRHPELYDKNNTQQYNKFEEVTKLIASLAIEKQGGIMRLYGNETQEKEYLKEDLANIFESWRRAIVESLKDAKEDKMKAGANDIIMRLGANKHATTLRYDIAKQVWVHMDANRMPPEEIKPEELITRVWQAHFNSDNPSIKLSSIVFTTRNNIDAHNIQVKFDSIHEQWNQACKAIKENDTKNLNALAKMKADFNRINMATGRSLFELAIDENKPDIIAKLKEVGATQKINFFKMSQSEQLETKNTSPPIEKLLGIRRLNKNSEVHEKFNLETLAQLESWRRAMIVAKNDDIVIRFIANKIETQLRYNIAENSWIYLNKNPPTKISVSNTDHLGDLIHTAHQLNDDSGFQIIINAATNNHAVDDLQQKYDRIHKEWTDACFAATEGNEEKIEELAKNGSDLNRINVGTGKSLLHIAVDNKKINVINKFIELRDQYKIDLTHTNSFENQFLPTPLDQVVKQQDIPLLEALVSANAGSGNLEKYGSSIAHVAASSNLVKVMDFLKKKHGTDEKYFNQLDKKGFTPLNKAAMQQKPDDKIINELIQLGANWKKVDENKEENILHVLAKNKTGYLIPKLIIKKTDLQSLIDQPNKEHKKPLEIAIEKSDIQSINELCNLGASLFQQNHTGVPYFRIAAEQNSHELIGQALKYVTSHSDSKVESEKKPSDEYKHAILDLDNHGNNLIHYAILNDANRVLTEFSKPEYKINLEQPNKNGETPLILALQNKRYDLALDLIESGAKINSSVVPDELRHALIKHLVLEDKTNRLNILAADPEYKSFKDDLNKPSPDGIKPFDSAIQNKKLDTATELLQFGAKLDDYPTASELSKLSKNDPKSKATPREKIFHTAALNNNENLVAELMKPEYSLDINYDHDKNGRTAYAEAVWNLNFPMVKLFLEAKTDVDYKNVSYPFGDTIATWLINNDQFKTLEKLVERHGLSILNEKDSFGYTPLYNFTTLKMYNEMRQLIKLNVDVNAISTNGLAPIHSAANNNDLTALNILLEHPEIKINTEISPLNYCIHGSQDIIRALVAKDALNDNFMKSHWDKTKEIIQTMDLEKDLEPEKLTKIYESYIKNAIIKRDYSAISELAKLGVNLTKFRIDGKNLAHIAVELNDAKFLYQLFVATVHDDNTFYSSPDSNGKTPLHLSVELGHKDVTKELLYPIYNVNIDSQDKFGKTPLFVSVEKCNVAIVDLLVQKYASISVPDKNLNTLYHVAASHKDAEIFNRLLRNDLNYEKNISQRNADGKAPVDIAIANENTTVILLLLNKDIELDNVQKKQIFDLAIKNANIELLTTLMSKEYNRPVSFSEMLDDSLSLKFTVDIGDYKNAQHYISLNMLNDKFIQKNWDTTIKILKECDLKSILPPDELKILHESALSTAIQKLDYPAIEALVKSGANLNKIGKEEKSITYMAVQLDRPEVVQKYSTPEHKPNLEFKDNLGKTALFVAAESLNFPILLTLIEAGAETQDILIPPENLTLAGFAAKHNQLAILETLVKKHGADILFQPDIQGRTPLHLATLHQNNRVVDYLVTNGADAHDFSDHTIQGGAKTDFIKDNFDKYIDRTIQILISMRTDTIKDPELITLLKSNRKKLCAALITFATTLTQPEREQLFTSLEYKRNELGRILSAQSQSLFTAAPDNKTLPPYILQIKTAFDKLNTPSSSPSLSPKAEDQVRSISPTKH